MEFGRSASLVLASVLALSSALFGDVHAADSAQRAEAALKTISAKPAVKAALEQIRREDERTLREQIEIAEIPAPSHQEQKRAQDYVRRLRELGLSEIEIDKEGNVIARRPGTRRNGPLLVLSAHLDTVFSADTNVKVRKEGNRYYGAGISDDARGLAVLLTVLRAMQEHQLRTQGDVLFVATVGEEGLGNLRGVKALFRDRQDIDGFISVDGTESPRLPPGESEVVTRAVGSHRWEITFIGPGGHSYENFGTPSAVHAMGRAISAISDLQPPAGPKTTFTVSIVSGGTAINAIAEKAQLKLDIRSENAAALAAMEEKIMAAAEQAGVEEGKRWGAEPVRVERKLLGDRPAGAGGSDNAVASAWMNALVALGEKTPIATAGSTDANVPMGLGIPAITASGGGIADKAHSLDEWYEPVRSWLGPQGLLLTSLALAGVEGGPPPLLTRRH
ncbi:M20/M25/M40 family metallo-hydrolase [Steroidobacter sp. S1-65]|uniref:M20/M25/M40 family metallo-hydrolase n=1 Tax=Steroidobacter gossypii TaxID=2805490 RepID=A0ABS1WWB5_9GAMM|nr:M20/M25/M40 family metallo-hydrolase [Steroidobacter gossypii]MBM0105264.1 M20/M25/M40 family metallo-hydrolase [Steroidobacter gossypii]